MGEVSKTVWQWLLDNIGKIGWVVIIILFLLSCFFKIAKKEINPLGWVLALIGKPLTKDVREDIEKLDGKVTTLKEDTNQQIRDLRSDLDGFEETTNASISSMKESTNSNCKTLKKELDAIKKSNDMQTIRQIRAHVLDFANSCMNGRPHTKKEFDNIIRENEQYEALVKKHKVKNAVYKEDYAFIKKKYDQCRETNSFLKDPEAGDTDVDLCESESEE